MIVSAPPTLPWVRGWLVMRSYPPEFGAFFVDRLSAEAKAREMGPDFHVKQGNHLPGTDRFAFVPFDGV